MTCDLNLLIVRNQKDAFPASLNTQRLRYTELTLLTKGSLEYQSGDRKLTMEPGDVLFLKTGSPRFRREGTVRSDYVSFNFQWDDSVDLPPLIRGGITGEIRCLLAALDHMEEKAPLSESADRIKHLILLILKSLEADLERGRRHPLVQKITAYLHSRFPDRVTLAEVAEHCFFSPVYCDSVFKRETGRSIIDYMIHYRLEEARRLLMQGNHSVSQIAEMTGFSDANYFSRLFKKKTGVTPLAYRRSFL
ncbi:MAG: helix-turn-helix transcriptional regulator [Clostridia bacterium]|nr:helix-turn-helix transcriptional regulator [Clostridia bacterium]